MKRSALPTDDPTWSVYKDAFNNDQIYTNFAYQNTQEQMDVIAKNLPDNYKLYLLTDNEEDLNKFSYRCAVFINYETKEVIFANAGTRPGLNRAGLDDFIDDALLIQEQTPRKFEMAQKLNKKILDRLGDQAKDFKFHYTGHSLGAAIAELATADMDIELQKRNLKRPSTAQNSTEQAQVSAVTFENPGTEPMVRRMYKGSGFTRDFHSVVVNNKPNAINSLNPQTGDVYTIDTRQNDPSMRQIFFSYLSKIVGNIHSAFTKICDFLGMGTLKEQMKGHKLASFRDTKTSITPKAPSAALTAVLHENSARERADSMQRKLESEYLYEPQEIEVTTIARRHNLAHIPDSSTRPTNPTPPPRRNPELQIKTLQPLTKN